MKITSLDVNALRNEEQYQFLADVLGIIEKYEAANLQVQSEFDKLKLLIKEEQSLFDLQSRSNSTQSLEDLDAKRDSLFQGLSLFVEASTYHFDPSVVDAAQRLTSILKEYGRIPRKSYIAESSALSKLVVEATTIYEKDFEKLRLFDWVSQLELANNVFQEVMYQRYQEVAGKAECTIKEVRSEADSTYIAMYHKLNAYALITNDAKYDAPFKELNAIIENYAILLADHKGKSVSETDQF